MISFAVPVWYFLLPRVEVLKFKKTRIFPAQERPFDLSREKNPALLSIESWLFKRDPFNGLF